MTFLHKMAPGTVASTVRLWADRAIFPTWNAVHVSGVLGMVVPSGWLYDFKHFRIASVCA